MSNVAGNAWQVTKTVFLRLRFIFMFVVVGLVVGNWEWIMNFWEQKVMKQHGTEQATGDTEWFCPMHPSVVRPNDKEKCPICFMPLSKRKKGEAVALPPGVAARLQLSGVRQAQAGVSVEEVAYRTLVREFRTVGTIEWDERRLSHPSVRVAGRVDELYVNFTGVRVKKGDPLYKLYSPDLVTTQEEYLLALKTLDEIKARGDQAAVDRAQRLADAARERMRLWGVADDQLAELEKSRQALTHIVLRSPVEGLVIRKDIDLGHYVNVGEDPWTLVDDSTVWVQAQVFERDLGLVKEGQSVEISSEAHPGLPFPGKVAFVAPEVAADTRTVKARIEIGNKEGLLKAGMFVSALFRIPIGKQGEVFWGC